MPVNKGAGGKNRRKGKGTINVEKPLIYRATGEEYGQVTKSLGNGYLEVMTFTDGGNILKRVHIRGKMRKKIWISVGDIVLISLRDFQDSVGDIIGKYTQDEVRLLKAQGELPDIIIMDGGFGSIGLDDNIIFDNVPDLPIEHELLVPPQRTNFDLISENPEEDQEEMKELRMMMAQKLNLNI